MTASPNIEETAAHRPLVTLVLFSYNQEAYVGEAVAAAFAQSYSPLEIILGDDGSTDRTRQIIREMAQSYDGPHRLVFDLSEHNVGANERVNRAVGMASGGFIVLAAGDDISKPDRVAVLVDEWRAAEWGDVSIFSGYDKIDAEGRFVATCIEDFSEVTDLHRLMETRMYSMAGATHGFAKNVFDRFGAILTRNSYEDRVIAFRSALLDGIRYVKKPLVRYRRHENALTIGRLDQDKLQYKRKELEIASSIYLNYLKDLHIHVAGDNRASACALQQTACDLYLKNRRRLALLTMASRRTRIAFLLRNWLKLKLLLADLVISLSPQKYI